jgi:hypothetical protein
MQLTSSDDAILPLIEDINVMFESELDVNAHQLYVDSLRTAAPMLMMDLAPLVFIGRRQRRYHIYPPSSLPSLNYLSSPSACYPPKPPVSMGEDG